MVEGNDGYVREGLEGQENSRERREGGVFSAAADFGAWAVPTWGVYGQGCGSGKSGERGRPRKLFPLVTQLSFAHQRIGQPKQSLNAACTFLFALRSLAIVSFCLSAATLW